MLGRTLPDSVVPGKLACPVGSPVCSQLTSLAMSLSNGYGNYHAAFTTLRLRNWHGVDGQANFTWGRALGTGATTQSTSGYTVADPWNLGAMYGPQSFDVKFLFNTGLVYHLPFYNSQRGLLGRALGGWSLAPLFTPQSGVPPPGGGHRGWPSLCGRRWSDTTNPKDRLDGCIPRLSAEPNTN